MKIISPEARFNRLVETVEALLDFCRLLGQGCHVPASLGSQLLPPIEREAEDDSFRFRA